MNKSETLHRISHLYMADILLCLLETLKLSMAKENKATQMYYNLLTVKANDKCYIPHTSDSLMLEVMKYYEHHGEPRQLMEAYYSLRDIGRSYSSQKEYFKGILFFNKAIDLAKTDKNDYLRKMVLAELSGTYREDKEYKKAKQCLIESKNFDNPLNKVPYFSNLAELYGSIGKTDSACFYFEKVLSPIYENKKNKKEIWIFDWNGNPIKKIDIENELITFCVDENDRTLFGIANIPEPTIVHIKL